MSSDAFSGDVRRSHLGSGRDAGGQLLGGAVARGLVRAAAELVGVGGCGCLGSDVLLEQPHLAVQHLHLRLDTQTVQDDA